MKTIVALLLIGCGGAPISRTPGSETPLFSMRSSFWLDLHERLYAETSERGAPMTPQADLDATEVAQWERALTFYREHFSDRGPIAPVEDAFMDTKRRLAEGVTDEELGVVLRSVESIYRAHGWPSDDRLNRIWIASLETRLAREGGAMARELASLYGSTWPSEPIRVEVAPNVAVLGAYTGGSPPSRSFPAIERATPATPRWR